MKVGDCQLLVVRLEPSIEATHTHWSNSLCVCVCVWPSMWWHTSAAAVVDELMKQMEKRNKKSRKRGPSIGLLMAAVRGRMKRSRKRKRRRSRTVANEASKCGQINLMAITSREGGKGLRKMMMMVVMKREREQQQWIAAYTLNLMTMSTRTNWLYCHIASLGQFGG